MGPLASPLLQRLALLLAVAPAASAQADLCANATDLGSGSTVAYLDLYAPVDVLGPATTGSLQPCVTAFRDVWFTWTATSTGTALLSLCGSSSFDTVLAVYTGPDCTSLSLHACNDDGTCSACGCGRGSLLPLMPVVAGTTYHIQVGSYDNGPVAPAQAMLGIAEGAGTCLLTADDFEEDNDTCERPSLLGDLWTDGLRLRGHDRDFYVIPVSGGETLEVIAVFDGAEVDVDLFLWAQAQTACGTDRFGPAAAAARSVSTGDHEAVQYTHPAGSGMAAVTLEVRPKGEDPDVCGGYALHLGRSQLSPPRSGLSYCDTTPNSVGSGARIRAIGATSVGGASLLLRAQGVPPQQFGIFVASRTSAYVTPLGPAADGVLCVGQPLGRFVGPGQIASSGPAGVLELALPFGAIPVGAGTVPIAPGDSWYFQAWYRDSVGFGANFSDGVWLVFSE